MNGWNRLAIAFRTEFPPATPTVGAPAEPAVEGT